MEKICPGVSTTWRLGPGDKLKEFHFCAGTTLEARQADPKLYFTSKEAVKCPFFGFCQDAINNRKNQDSNQEYMHKPHVQEKQPTRTQVVLQRGKVTLTKKVSVLTPNLDFSILATSL